MIPQPREIICSHGNKSSINTKLSREIMFTLYYNNKKYFLVQMLVLSGIIICKLDGSILKRPLSIWSLDRVQHKLRSMLSDNSPSKCFIVVFINWISIFLFRQLQKCRTIFVPFVYWLFWKISKFQHHFRCRANDKQNVLYS